MMRAHLERSYELSQLPHAQLVQIAESMDLPLIEEVEGYLIDYRHPGHSLSLAMKIAIVEAKNLKESS